MTYVVCYLTLVAVMSAVAFVVYGLDKKRAGVPGARRVPERTLHLIGLCGGWPGALAARRWFRHKTRKGSFVLAFWFVVLSHVTIVAALVYLWTGPIGG